MSPAVSIPLQEYLDQTYRLDREYLEGEVRERHLGEVEHCRLQALLSRYLSNREAEWGVRGSVLETGLR